MPVAALLLVVSVGLAVLLLAPGYWTPSVALVAAYLVTPAGQEVWVPLAHALFDLPVPYVAFLLLCVNATVSMAAATLPVDAVAQRIPWLGRKVAAFSRRVETSAWSRLGVAGALSLAIATPLHTGGAILGSLAGRALGLSAWRTVAAVVLGVGVRLLVVALVVGGVLAAWR